MEKLSNEDRQIQDSEGRSFRGQKRTVDIASVWTENNIDLCFSLSLSLSLFLFCFFFSLDYTRSAEFNHHVKPYSNAPYQHGSHLLAYGRWICCKWGLGLVLHVVVHPGFAVGVWKKIFVVFMYKMEVRILQNWKGPRKSTYRKINHI